MASPLNQYETMVTSVMFKSIITLVMLITIPTTALANEFVVTYRGSQANSHVCKASYDVLVSDEGSKYAADNMLLEFISKDALHFLVIYTGAGSVNSQDYKNAFKKLDRGPWNTNTTQLGYCISYNYN